MKLGFYRAFEDKYRGSRELIKSRLRVYLPFLIAMKESLEESKALDVGCGRGEWLEVLKEEGIEAVGIDLDDDMLEACRQRGLTVETAEAVSYIKSLPDESFTLISGFHFAEHLPFADLQAFVQEALRVLKPAGLLILETPNPENIMVGTTNFYLDPTHNHPLPPDLLSFLPEYYGFYRTQILRLQERKEVLEAPETSLYHVLSEVSPDYSIVAQKRGHQDRLDQFTSAFKTKYGLTLGELSTRYDDQTRGKLRSTIMELEQARAEANGLRAELGGVRAELGGVLTDRANIRSELERITIERNLNAYDLELIQKEHKKVSDDNQRLRQKITEMDLTISRLRIELDSVYASTSWKVSAPVRNVKNILSRIIGIFRRSKKTPVPATMSMPVQEAVDEKNLSLRVGQTYRDLVDTIEKKKNADTK
jgi:O-antigen chain-terminating methyltransferase